MKQRLLLICQHFYPEMVSTGLHMTELAVALQNTYTDFDIEVLCSYPSKNTFTGESITDRYRNVTIIRKRSNGKEHGGVLSRLLFSLSFFLRVCAYLLLHHNKYRGFIITTNPPFLGLATVLMKKLFGKRYLLIVYDIYPDIAVKMGILKAHSIITRLWNIVTRNILQHATTLSVIGRDMEKIIAAKLQQHNKKSVLIHNWADATHVKPIAPADNLFLQQHPELQHKILFVYSGNMGRTHNMEDIVALANACKEDDTIRFVIIGGGAKYEQMKQAAVTAQNILALPYQPFALLPHVLSASTFCLVCLDKAFTGYSVPSKTYGIMAAGKPVIAFLDAESEIGMAITESECGFVISPGTDPAKVLGQIRGALDSGAYIQMGMRARAAFDTSYTLTIAAEKYHAALTSTFAQG